MTRIFQRQSGADLPVAVDGDGVYIVDSQGKRYIDASGTAAVSCLGYSDADVKRAVKEQVDRLSFTHSGFFTSEAAEELADLLVAGAPPGIGWVYYTSGGSEAVETALKMSRQYFIETGEGERCRFIARRQSYHGNTLGALAVGGNRSRREPYHPLFMESAHISPCYAYRGMAPDETEQAYGARVADELEAMSEKLGPETVCAFLAETVVGATAGVVPPVAGYFKRIRDICHRHGVHLILDEVMCGTGRTGTLHACEQEGIAPDMIALAKGLGAGYQPIGAVLVAEKIYDAFRRGSGVFRHGHTYMGHPVACAAALAVQRAIQSRDLLADVRARGEVLAVALNGRFGDHPNVGDIRGRGLFWGLEMVADRAAKEPFDPALGLHLRIKERAMEHGLVCYPGGGTADGVKGDHVLLAPPFIVDEGQIAEITERLAGAIDAALGDIAG